MLFVAVIGAEDLEQEMLIVKVEAVCGLLV